MKMHLKKAAAFVLAVLVISGAFTGCAINLNPSDSETPAMVVCGEKMNLDEVKMYVYMSQYATESNYYELLLASYESFEAFWVDKGYWQQSLLYEGSGKAYQTKLLVKYAKSNNITLTDEEKAAVEKVIGEAKTKYAKVLEHAGNPSDAVVRRYFEENALANKAYQTIVSDIDTTFDEDAMRRKTFEGVYVVASTTKAVEEDTKESGTETETNAESESASANEYTEEEQDLAREVALKKAYDMLKEGKTLNEIKEAFTDDPTVSVYSIENRSISLEQTTTLNTTYPYYPVAWELKTGEYSKDVIETSSGSKIGYALHMLNDDDPDARASAKESELASRRSKAFTEVYSKLLEQYKDMHVYTDKTIAIEYKGDVFDVPESEKPTETPTEVPSESETETEPTTEESASK